MATLTVDDTVLLKVDEFAKKEEISREDFVNRAIKQYLHEKLTTNLHEYGERMGIAELSGAGRSKLEIVESLFGIIPNDETSLAELREERLSRYENTD